MSAKPSPERDRARFWKYAVTSEGCWGWQGHHSKKGYAHAYWAGKTVRAHRLAWMLTYGSWPSSETLDHLCNNRSCVRPDHLREATNRENILRGCGITAVNAVKQYCLRGHPFIEANTRINRKGHRTCRACHNARTRRLKARIRAKVTHEGASE